MKAERHGGSPASFRFAIDPRIWMLALGTFAIGTAVFVASIVGPCAGARAWA